MGWCAGAWFCFLYLDVLLMCCFVEGVVGWGFLVGGLVLFCLSWCGFTQFYVLLICMPLFRILCFYLMLCLVGWY